MSVKAAIMVPHPPLIVPDIGRGQEDKIKDTVNAYDEAARFVAAFNPETLLLISPHQIMYSDYFHISPGQSATGDFSNFSAPQVKMEVKYDTKLVSEITKIADVKRIPAGTMGERDKNLDHGTMVPLYFINKYIKDYKLVRIGLSGLHLTTHYEFGECIREAVENLGRDVVIVGSGDLSHRLKEDGPYGLHKNGPLYDERIMDVMGRGAFGELFEFTEDFLDGAGECGHRSFVIMAGILDKTAVTPKKLSHQGTFGVGYGVCTYEINGDDEERNFREQFEQLEVKRFLERRKVEDDYVRLARETIETYVGKGRKIDVPDNLKPEMYDNKAGVFVSIKKQGRLRGCIGTISACTDSIAQEIIDNAISASTRDPRFSPIKPAELDSLTISVDVLGDAESIDSPDDLDVKRYGVIVEKGMRRGLLLPNLDGVDTVEEQIAIAKQKAGIEEDEEVKLKRFEVVRHF